MAPPTGTPTQPPPGPSARHRLNLIDEITRAAVASDYDDGSWQQPAGSRRQRVLVAAVALGLAGFVLALGISARVLNDPVVNDQRSALNERIVAADARNEALSADVGALRRELAGARADNLRVTLAGAQLADDIEALELVTGYASVHGPGAVVTLTDAPVTEAAEGAEVERVLDSDVQSTVNGLWSAGAEAIAVNGQRLTAQSAIRSAAGAILVNYRPLKPPYLVAAIGPPDLAQKFQETPDASALGTVSEQFGIGLEISSVDRISLLSATSPLPSDAKVVSVEQAEGEG
jgi:uncharacterized protein YlxW (UPF0749 family)